MSEPVTQISPDEQSQSVEPAKVREPSTVRVNQRDELGVVLQKIRDESNKNIRLVVPERSIIAQGSVGLKLLAEEAEKMGRHIEVATDSSQIQTLARRAGLTMVAGAGESVVHGFRAHQDAAVQPSEALSRNHDALGPVEHMYEPARPTSTAAAMAGPAVWKQIFLPFKRVKIGWVAAVAAVLLVLGMGGLYAAATYLPQAEVTVYTQERTLDRDLSVSADPSATTADAKSLVVPAIEITADATKSQSFPATGKKDIGNKATGQVTIFNYTNQDKKLPAGTGLSASKLSFSLDAAVTVPAATISIKTDPLTHTLTTATTPGQVNGSITAAVLGTDSNLPANTTFAVSGYDASSITAQNSDALSGGSKQTVTIITADDRSQALDTVTQDAQDAATAALKAKVTDGQLLLDEAATMKTSSSDFSGKVGDQAEQFTLSVTEHAKAPVINESDLKSMLNTAIAAKVPDGYTLDSSHSTVDTHVLKVDSDGTIHLTATFKTQILPQVDVAAMKAAIKGKNPSAVEDYLKNQPNLNGYDIKLTPKLPGPFYKLPSIDSHIHIQVQVKK